MRDVAPINPSMEVGRAVWITREEFEQLTDEAIVAYGDAIGATIGQENNKKILVQIKEKAQRFLYVWDLRNSLYDYFLKNS